MAKKKSEPSKDAETLDESEFTMPVKEAAERVGKAQNTLIRYAKTGKLPHKLEGEGFSEKPRFLFRPADIEALAKGSTKVVVAEMESATTSAQSPQLRAAAKSSPKVFKGWTAGDWDDLRGILEDESSASEAEILDAAGKINRKRDTRRKFEAVLETHLAPSLVAMIDALFSQTAENRTKKRP